MEGGEDCACGGGGGCFPGKILLLIPSRRFRRKPIRPQIFLVVPSIIAESDTSLTILDLSGGGGGSMGPGGGPHHQALVAATRTMESSYENEVGVIDWVGKVFIPAY